MSWLIFSHLLRRLFPHFPTLHMHLVLSIIPHSHVFQICCLVFSHTASDHCPPSALSVNLFGRLILWALFNPSLSLQTQRAVYLRLTSLLSSISRLGYNQMCSYLLSFKPPTEKSHSTRSAASALAPPGSDWDSGYRSICYKVRGKEKDTLYTILHSSTTKRIQAKRDRAEEANNGWHRWWGKVDKTKEGRHRGRTKQSWNAL